MSLAKVEPKQPVSASPALLGLLEARTVLSDYVTLTKPRIMVLLLFTEYAAMVVASKGLPGLRVTVFGLLGLMLSTGGAAALNMWYDRDIDVLMERTKGRPIPAGRVSPVGALAFGLVLLVLSFAVLGFGLNWFSAWLAVAGFIYYVVIYTMWLKRRTPQNIVIGGGAGAFPPLVGWSVVTGHLAWPAVLMFLVIFLWTPPHFWALALYKHDDYKRAHIPMMPVVRGAKTTKWQSLVYTVLLLASSILLYYTHAVGLVYLAAAILLGVGFVIYTAMSLLEKSPNLIWAKRTFKFSLIYLSVLFVVMILNVHR